MNLKKSFLICAALLGSATVSADCRQALILAKGIQAVYWLNGSEQSAIAYDDEHENQLKQFVITHLNNENRVALEHCLPAGKSAERLILVGEEQSYEVKLTADCLIYQGNGYFVSSKKLADFKAANQDKVAQGEAVSEQRLQQLKSQNLS